MTTYDEIQRGLKAIYSYSTDELAVKIAAHLLNNLADQPADGVEDYEAEARHYDQHGCPEEAELCRQKARGDEESVASSEALTDAEEQELANMGLTCSPAHDGDTP
jgi:hypothetical protein